MTLNRPSKWQRNGSALLLVLALLAGCALTQGIDMSESVSDVDACSRYADSHTAGMKAWDARVITDREVVMAYLLVSVHHGDVLLAQQRRGPRTWTAEEDATFRQKTYDDCLWQRRGRQVPR